MTAERPRLVAVTSHRPHELAEPLERVGGAAEIVHIDTDGFLARNVTAVRETRRAIRHHDPDVVLFDSRELLGALIAVVCLLSRVPFVFRFKGDYWRGPQDTSHVAEGDGFVTRLVYRLGSSLNEFIYAGAIGYIVVSDELRDIVVERTGCARERVQVVSVPLVPGVDDGDGAAARRRFGIEEDTILLTVTNLDYRGKTDGVRLVIEGILPILEAHEDVGYVVAGGGQYLPEIERFVERTATDPEVRSRLYPLGFVDDVADLYALADGFLYVSFIDGYPRSVLEAQQAGLPAVVNAAHGMVEQVRHGESGFLIDRPTPAAVTERVERLLASEAERTRLGENGRNRAERENDPEVIGRKLVDAVISIHTASAGTGTERSPEP